MVAKTTFAAELIDGVYAGASAHFSTKRRTSRNGEPSVNKRPQSGYFGLCRRSKKPDACFAFDEDGTLPIARLCVT